MKKGKNITALRSESIAVPDVKKLYIMALLHKYEKGKKENNQKHPYPLIKPLKF